MDTMQSWVSPWGWIAVGTVREDGSMEHALVSDADGIRREDNYYFQSKTAFLEYVDRINKEIMKRLRS